MKFFSPARKRVEKDRIIRIHRILTGEGTINVSARQEVTPEDIIGSGQILSGFRTLNLSTLLSVAPNQAVKYLKKSLGQRIFKGELIAVKDRGVFTAEIIVTSPTDGILDYLNSQTGELRMNLLPRKQDLTSGVYGIVELVDVQRGLIQIRTQASIVSGMFGLGKVRNGILRIIGKRDELTNRSFGIQKLNEQIIVGGSLIFREAISAAISSGVSGIISGGINARDYKAMSGGRLIFPHNLENDSGISIVVCEGFGSIPIGLDIYEILTQYNGKFAVIDGNAGVINLPSFKSSSIIKVRGTQLPPIEDINLSGDRYDQNRVMELTIGQTVRVIGNSYSGEQGRVVALDQTQTHLASGIKAYMATIETRSRKIAVPVANCEIIGYSL